MKKLNSTDMKTKGNYFVISFLSLFLSANLFANNVGVKNVSVANQDISAGTNNAANFTHVKFDVKWDNSWRVTGGPANWDAVWIFAKYQKIGTSDYKHVTLSATSGHHSVTTTNGVGVTIAPSADGKGVFMYRSAGGTGSIDWRDVLLRWNYRTDGLLDGDSVTVKVFAIEMVYIPQGSFYIGDGNAGQTPSDGAFSRNRRVTLDFLNLDMSGQEAYLVTSEGPIDFISGHATTGSLSMADAYDPSTNATYSYTLPASYPKGYNAYYAMKYEVSQAAYVDFFNTLPANASKTNRNLQLGSSATIARNNFFWDNALLTNDADLTRLSSTASGDRAQNYMGFNDAIAYADWAALRPMSELEWEKAARGHDVTNGPVYPVNKEYAWGNTVINQITGGITGDNSNSERLTNTTGNINAHFGSTTFIIGTGTGNTYGPVRNGFFAATNSPTNQRQEAGASYYGLMEMTGNLEEIVIAPYWRNQTYANRVSKFDGTHGDGELDYLTGNADVSNWELVAQIRTNTLDDIFPVVRGGGFHITLANVVQLATSYRSVNYGSYGQATTAVTPSTAPGIARQTYRGFRAVRTAP